MSGSCDPSTGQRSRSPHSWSGDRTCRTGPPPLPYALLAPGARPIGSRLRLLGFTISLLVPPYLDPVSAANATEPSFLLGSGRRPGSHRGAGPGRIQRAEKGRAEPGARGRGPAGVQWARTGLAAWRAGGPLWPLSRVPGAGDP